MVRKLNIPLLIALFASCAIYGQQPFQKDKEVINPTMVPQMIELNGVAERLFIDSCEFTLTASDFGLHLMVTTDEQQEIYVHLGPVWATSIWTEGIEDEVVHLVVFRYEHLPENEYVAKELQWGGHVAVFRDENLMPFWVNGYNQGIW